MVNNLNKPLDFMKISSQILLLFIFLAIVSCDSDIRKELKRIDSFIESEPEKAMGQLEMIRHDVMSRQDSAYYALLYTQAQIKCGIEVASDSLIESAYTFYGHGDSGDLKKRTYFYRAKISYNGGDLRGAMRDIMVSYNISKDSDDSYWIAKSAELIGDILYDAYNYGQSELYTLEAVENYKKADKTANHRYALCDLASTYLNQDKDRDAIILLDSIRYVVAGEKPFDSALNEYIMSAMNSAFLKVGRFEALDSVMNIDRENVLTSADDDLDNSIIKSYWLNERGNATDASQLLLATYKLTSNDRESVRVLYAAYNQALTGGDYRRAALMSDTLLAIQSNIAKEVLKESVTGEQRDFYISNAEYQKKKSKFLLGLFVTGITVALLIILLLLFIYRLKLRAKKAELESNLSSLLYFKEQAEHIGIENTMLSRELSKQSRELMTVHQQLEEKQNLEAQNALVIEHLFKEKWSTLNMLCNEYFEMGQSENTRGIVLCNIEKELKKLRDKKNIKEIEIAVDSYMGSIMSLLRSECPFLKENDFVLLSLVFAGLSVRAVCLFTDMKYKLFYLKKSRLYKRIESSDAPHKDLFLSKIR